MVTSIKRCLIIFQMLKIYRGHQEVRRSLSLSKSKFKNMRMDYNVRLSMLLRVNALVVVFMLRVNLCPASSCGNIPNISYPFLLTTDPEYRGVKDYPFRLSCENNQRLVLYQEDIKYRPYLGRLYRQYKYYVQAINYNNHTIRILDSNLEKDNIPLFAPYIRYPLYILRNSSQLMILVSCEGAVNLSSHYRDDIEFLPYNCNNNTMSDSKLGHHSSYLMLGATPYVSDVPDLCHIEMMVRTSSPGISMRNNKQHSSISYSEFHKAMLYGVEISWEALLRRRFYYQIVSNIEYQLWRNGIIRYIIGCGEMITSFMGTNNILINTILYFVRTGSMLIITFLVLRALLGAPCVIAFLIYKWERRHLSMFPAIEEFLETNNNFLPIRYNYSDIKKITTNFKDKLGEGGYGYVFKGKLRNGGLVAVKILSKSKTNGQDFINEVSTIGRIHHVNVVRLVGFCIEGSKRALVYDLMSNGSLDKYISFNSKEVIVNSLSYKAMFDISLGVASGIDYLHGGCHMQILHFDIKPHNVLLDENFVPKISDFGLARLCPLETNIVSMTAARGTLGYIAPELFYKNIGGVSFKADVYSFGKLLMEMASKRKNLNVTTEHSNKIYFPLWVYDQLCEGNNIELGDDVTEEESKLVKKMIIVALWCIQLKPSDRPSMKKVIEMLEGRFESLSIPPKLLLYPSQRNNLSESVENMSSTLENSSTLLEFDSSEISLIENAN